MIFFHDSTQLGGRNCSGYSEIAQIATLASFFGHAALLRRFASSRSLALRGDPSTEQEGSSSSRKTNGLITRVVHFRALVGFTSKFSQTQTGRTNRQAPPQVGVLCT